MGFKRSPNEATLYIKEDAKGFLVVSVYVDDILVTGSGSYEIEGFKAAMKTSFEMNDLRKMSYFLGMEMVQSEHGILIHQRKYIKELLIKFCMDKCKSMSTPFAVGQKLIKDDGSP